MTRSILPHPSSSVVEGYLKEARGSKFEEAYDMAEFHANPVTQEVLDRIKDDKHVLIDWKPTLDLLMKTEYGKTKRCEYSIGIEEFYTERIALAFPIGNPWIERFDERYSFKLDFTSDAVIYSTSLESEN